MPTYEYECKQCGHTFEVFQSMSDEPLKNCTKCGNTVRRLIFGGAGVIFKGSGFYVTDKGSSASRDAGASKNTGKAAGKDAEQSAKTESKPAGSAATAASQVSETKNTAHAAAQTA